MWQVQFILTTKVTIYTQNWIDSLSTKSPPNTDICVVKEWRFGSQFYKCYACHQEIKIHYPRKKGIGSGRHRKLNNEAIEDQKALWRNNEPSNPKRVNQMWYQNASTSTVQR